MKDAVRSSAAGKAAAVFLAIGLGLFAAASAQAAPAKTKLTLTGPRHSPAAGQTVSLAATLTAGGKPVAGKIVALTSGGSQVGSATTDAKGKAAFSVQVTAGAAYQAKFTPSAADAAALTGATSKTLRLRLARALTGSIQTFLHAGNKAVGIPRVAVRISGTVAPYSAGQQVTIDVFKKSKRVKHKLRAVRAAAQGKGAFALAFKPGGRGTYTIRVTSGSASKHARLDVVRPHAHSGSRGTAVRALQSRLAELGYLTPVNGFFNSSTSRAVLAFRKVNGYARTTSASRAVFAKLAHGGGGFHVKYPKAGKHVEFDWSRQVLVLARGAQPDKILHASSGKPSTPTVFGSFHFYSKTPGFNSHGMYYSNYFVGGYAIHGYAEVPSYAASHGCIRIPIPSSIAVYRWISLGDPIYVYH
jgi:hypothetical protein